MIYSNNPTKWFVLGISIFLSAALTPYVYGIIWFEQENHHQTLINQLLSFMMWWILSWIFIIQPPTFLLFALGPFKNPEVCLLHTFARNVVMLIVLLLQNLIIGVRYIFIFRVKNPTAVQNDFWRLFLNIWTIGFSVISQLLYIWLPGKNPVYYYVCMGDFPENMNSHFGKRNMAFTALVITSFLMFTVLRFRTFFSDKKETKLISPFGTKPLFSFTAIGLGIFLVVCLQFITRIVNKMNVHVNYHQWLCGLLLISPQLVIGYVVIIYYVQHSNLRNKIWLELIT
jgi:hypothetical protein